MAVFEKAVNRQKALVVSAQASSRSQVRLRARGTHAHDPTHPAIPGKNTSALAPLSPPAGADHLRVSPTTSDGESITDSDAASVSAEDGLGFPKVQRLAIWRWSHEDDFHDSVECAIRADLSSPAAGFVPSLRKGEWTDDPEHDPPHDDE